MGICLRAEAFGEAIRVFKRMHAAGLKPDMLAFNLAVTACEKAGLWQGAIDIIEEMKRENLTPDW
ncbi:unnamed protein product [Discosporangium mesarthrocarpum]